MFWYQRSVKLSGWKMPLSRVLSWENPCLFLPTWPSYPLSLPTPKINTGTKSSTKSAPEYRLFRRATLGIWVRSWNWILSQVGHQVLACHTQTVGFRALRWDHKWLWGRKLPAWPLPCLLLTVADTQVVRRWPYTKCGWMKASPRLQLCLFPCAHLISPRLEAMREGRKWQLK